MVKDKEKVQGYEEYPWQPHVSRNKFVPYIVVHCHRTETYSAVSATATVTATTTASAGTVLPSGFFDGAFGTWGMTGDLNWSQVAMLMRMEGTEGSTAFTDSSSWTVSLSAVSGVTMTLADQKYGASSAYFDGITGRIAATIDNGNDLSLVDFTVEMFIKPSLSSSFTMFLTKRASNVVYGPIALFCTPSPHHLRMNASTSGSAWSLSYSSSTPLTLNTWQHIAMSRQGNIFRLFHEGTMLTEKTLTGSLYVNSDPWGIGGDTNSGRYKGYMDNFRFTIGTARYTGNFTPPTADFYDF